MRTASLFGRVVFDVSTYRLVVECFVFGGLVCSCVKLVVVVSGSVNHCSFFTLILGS